MTQFKKRVIRELAENWDHHGRHIVIELTPPDLVSFRERGKSRKYTAQARWIMQKIIEHDFETQ
jgi:hypothetical protein